MIFRIVSLAVLIVAIIWLNNALRARKLSIGQIVKWWRSEFKDALALLDEKGYSDPTALRRVAYLFGLDLVTVLAITGLLQPWILGDHMSGALLMLHMVAAPLFAISLIVFTVLTAYSQRYTADDNSMVMKLKACFWGIIILGLTAILTSTLSMFPLANMDLQYWLIGIHRWAAIALLVLLMVYGYFVAVVYYKPMEVKK